jgi:hypothetical protein
LHSIWKGGGDVRWRGGTDEGEAVLAGSGGQCEDALEEDTPGV